MNPVQRPLENVFKHPPIIMDLAVDLDSASRTGKIVIGHHIRSMVPCSARSALGAVGNWQLQSGSGR